MATVGGTTMETVGGAGMGSLLYTIGYRLLLPGKDSKGAKVTVSS